VTKKKRIIAFITAFAMAFALIFSVFFIAHNSQHKCSGNDCEICAQINLCIGKLNKITPKPETEGFAVLLAFAVISVIGAVHSAANRKSLTQLKVKLSN